MLEDEISIGYQWISVIGTDCSAGAAQGCSDCGKTVKTANTTILELLYLHDYLELGVKQGIWDYLRLELRPSHATR